MVLTRMEWGAHSAARDLARWDTAAFEALCFGEEGGCGLVNECKDQLQWDSIEERKGKER